MIEMANESAITKVSRVFLRVYTYTARWNGTRGFVPAHCPYRRTASIPLELNEPDVICRYGEERDTSPATARRLCRIG